MRGSLIVVLGVLIFVGVGCGGEVVCTEQADGQIVCEAPPCEIGRLEQAHCGCSSKGKVFEELEEMTVRGFGDPVQLDQNQLKQSPCVGAHCGVAPQFRIIKQGTDPDPTTD